MHSHTLSLSRSLSRLFSLRLGIIFKRIYRAYRDQRIHVGFCDAALFCDSVQGRPGSFILHEKQGDTWSPHVEEETGASRVRVIQLWDDSLFPSLSAPPLCPFNCVRLSLSPTNDTPSLILLARPPIPRPSAFGNSRIWTIQTRCETLFFSASSRYPLWIRVLDLDSWYTYDSASKSSDDFTKS